MQAQNLSIRGTLLQKEAELLSVRDQLWRSEETQKELREELIRVNKRNGSVVDHEQVEVHALSLTLSRVREQELIVLENRLLLGHAQCSRDSFERFTSFPLSPTFEIYTYYSLQHSTCALEYVTFFFETVRKKKDW